MRAVVAFYQNGYNWQEADRLDRGQPRELARVQEGLEPTELKPMASIGLGVFEIRVRDEGAFRVIYVAKFTEAVYVLHAFQKKAQKTPKPEIELARKRYRAMLKERKGQ